MSAVPTKAERDYFRALRSARRAVWLMSLPAADLWACLLAVAVGVGLPAAAIVGLAALSIWIG